MVKKKSVRPSTTGNTDIVRLKIFCGVLGSKARSSTLCVSDCLVYRFVYRQKNLLIKIIITTRVMLTCAVRAQDKKPKSRNIPSNFAHSIYYKVKN